MKHSRAATVLVSICSAVSVKADPADDWVRHFMEKTHVPGIALAVIHKGQVAKAAVYGSANLEWKQPVTRTSPFWLDSLTKLFTAVGVMQLSEQGKLALDEPIAKYLPDTPPAWRGVNVRHLLTHSSGIKDDYWQLYRGSPLVNYDEKDIYAYAISQPSVFAPGERYAYNNEGYYLLGLIITKVTGEPYTKWIAEHVLKAAGMRSACTFNPSEIIPQMVTSYDLKEGRIIHNRADIVSDRGEAIAGWGLYASLDDMIAFDSAFRGARILSPESLTCMWSNAKINCGYPSPSGIGFNKITYERAHRAAFKGGQAGVVYTVYPEDDLSVIFLTNLEASTWIDAFSANEIAHFFAPEIQPLSALKPQPDPDSARTARLRQAMTDIASGVSPSPLLTSTMCAAVTADIRAEIKQLLAAMSGFEFLDDEKASMSDPYGAAHYCYYRTKVGAAFSTSGSASPPMDKSHLSWDTRSDRVT